MMRFIKKIKLGGYDEEIQIWHCGGKWGFSFQRFDTLCGTQIRIRLGPYQIEYSNLDPY